jgi:hypothetical protein
VESASLLAPAAQQALKTKSVHSLLSPGGAWCWYNGPTVVDYQGQHSKRYAGWIQTDGSVIIASIDLNTGTVVQTNLHAGFADTGGGTPSNDHASPGIAVRPDGRIIVFYAQQAGSALYYQISTNPEDISSFGSELTVSGAGDIATYPHPHFIGSTLFLIHSIGGEWRIITSTDGGVSWGPLVMMQTASPNPGAYPIFVNNGGNTPGSATRIDWATSMAPDASGSGYASLSNLWHGYFDGMNFYTTAGAVICSFASLPVITSPNVAHGPGGVPIASMTEVYAYTTNGVCSVWDLGYDSSGNPVIVFDSFPLVQIGDTDTAPASRWADHRYNYAHWNGSAWTAVQITAAGGQIGSALSGEEGGAFGGAYSGGLALLQSDPTVVYLSRQITPPGGQPQFEIERWVTPDGFGATWKSAPLTYESDSLNKNLRPMTPRQQIAGSPDVMWMYGAYKDYTVFQTQIAMSAETGQELARRSAVNRPLGAGVTDPLLAPAVAIAPALLLPLSASLGDASGNGNTIEAAVAPVFGKGRYAGIQELEFDGVIQCLNTWAQPFTPGNTITFFGRANRANNAANHVLFGSDDNGAANSHCALRIKSGGEDVNFFADVTTDAGVTWTAAWPGTAQSVAWALIVNQSADTVELYINGVSQGVKSDSVQWGSAGNYLQWAHRGAFYANVAANTVIEPFNGSMSIAGYITGALTPTQIQALAGLVPPIPSRKDLVVRARGFVSETFDFSVVSNSNQLSLVSGTMYGQLAGFQVGDTLTGIGLYSTLTGAGAGATLFKVGLLERNGNVRAVSADYSASLAATMNLIPFTAPVTIPQLGDTALSGGFALYLCVLAIFSGTAPKMMASGLTSMFAVGYNSGSKLTVSEAGLSDFAAVGSAMSLASGPSEAIWLAAY